MAAAVCLLLATFTAVPVSTTHAIVGGVVGSIMFQSGVYCLDFTIEGFGGNILPWFVSMALAGVMCSSLCLSTECLIFNAKDPRRNALLDFPSCFKVPDSDLAAMI